MSYSFYKLFKTTDFYRLYFFSGSLDDLLGGDSMKVVLLNGSPNERGCTNRALTEVSSALNNNNIVTEFFWIGRGPVYGCTSCGYCRKKGEGCIYTDDPCNSIINLFKESDGIIIGSPVFYSGPNGALCAVLDRVFFAGSDNFKYKPAAAISSCRRAGSVATFDRLNKYFSINNMPIVSSQYWNNIYGTNPEETAKDLEGMQIMRRLGENMAWMLKNLSGEKTNPPVMFEDVVMTNFIR